MNVMNFILYSDRIHNIAVNDRVRKTDLLMAFRSEMAIAEGSARRIIEDAIKDGELIEELENKTKWISVPKAKL